MRDPPQADTAPQKAQKEHNDDNSTKDDEVWLVHCTASIEFAEVAEEVIETLAAVVGSALTMHTQ